MKETLGQRIKFYQNLIPPIFSGSFPQDFRLASMDWIIDSKTVNRPLVPAEINGKTKLIRPISTMDVEFLSDEIVHKARNGSVDLVSNYPCGLNCPGCFSEEAIFGDRLNLMTWREVMSVIDSARSIGLSSIKFLGPGELFQNPDLFEILDACEERSLPISIFTKGAELGDDELARRNFSYIGISSAPQLISRLSDYNCVRILLGFNSFFPSRQDALVGSGTTSTYEVKNGTFINRGIALYTQKRDKALVGLVQAGFNNPARGQRLTLAMAPLQKNQLDEVAEIYEWSARRNIPVIITPTMESGPKAQGLVKVLTKNDPDNSWLYDTYLKVYERAFALGIFRIEDVEQRGLSPYIGTEGCNQVANGLMLRLNGQVKICPGSSKATHLYGSVRDSTGILRPNSIVDIWYNSPNYRYGARENNWCPAKTTMLPEKLRKDVLLLLGERCKSDRTLTG